MNPDYLVGKILRIRDNNIGSIESIVCCKVYMSEDGILYISSAFRNRYYIVNPVLTKNGVDGKNVKIEIVNKIK